MPTVFLIDANIYVHIAWCTVSREVTGREGKPVNALIGFSDFLLKLLREEKPEHVMVAFDGRGCFRHRLCDGYKSNRLDKDPELISQLSLCRELTEALGLCCLSSEEYEADDLIGTVARHYRNDGFHCHFVSRDKDLTQLMRPGDWWWGGKGGQRLDYEGVKKKFEVFPEQIADYLALVGDSVDSIRGVTGIGKITAAKLLAQHGSAARIIESGVLTTGEIEQLHHALRLTHIVCEAPLQTGTIARCRRRTGDNHRLDQLAQQTPNPEYLLNRWLAATTITA